MHVTVDRGLHGQQRFAFEIEHLGHGEAITLGVAQRAPYLAAVLARPGVEFGEAAPAAQRSLDPDASAAVLQVLLDDAILPAGRDVAEFGIDERALTAWPLPFSTRSAAVFMLS